MQTCDKVQGDVGPGSIRNRQLLEKHGGVLVLRGDLADSNKLPGVLSIKDYQKC